MHGQRWVTMASGQGGHEQLRVLHVVLDLHEGGLQRVVYDLLRESSAHVDAAVMCLAQLGRLGERLPPAQVCVMPAGTGTSLIYPSRIAEAIRSHAPAVVHLHSGVWLKGAYAARMAGVQRVIFSDHGRAYPDPWPNKIADRLGALGTDVVVAVSAALGVYLRQALRIPGRRIRVIANGVSVPPRSTVASAAATRHGLGIAPHVPVIAAVGRLDPVKAYDLLIDALAEVRQRWHEGDGARPILLLIGDGPERERLQALAERHGLTAAIRFLGWRTDVREILSALDLFVLCSDSEGTSMSLLEAMAAGRPVLATAVGGTPDVLGDALRTQLVPKRDRAALVDGIFRTLRDSTGGRQVGETARRRVETTYSVASMIRAYESLYTELVY